MASLLCLVAITAIALLPAAAAGQGGKIMRPSWAPDCSTADNYTADSQYKRNLDQLLAALPAAAGDSGWFYESSAGAGDDEVYGLIMCYADYNAAACQDCLSRAPAGITTVCPGSRSVRVVYDACTLRYSDAPILETADLTYLFRVRPVVPGVTVTLTGLEAVWAPLMSKLKDGAATSPLRLANDTAPYDGKLVMYGLAQCTRDLDGTDCSRCIGRYISLLEGLFPNNSGGVIKGYSCYLRYQVGEDFGTTLPPLTPGKHIYS